MHEVEWRKVREVLEETAPGRPHVNAWQRDLFQRHGVARRQISEGTRITSRKHPGAEQRLLEYSGFDTRGF